MIDIIAIDGISEGAAYLIPADLAAKLATARANGSRESVDAVLAEVASRATECAVIRDCGEAAT